MTDTKTLLRSRAVWGAAIAIVAGVAGVFGWTLDEAAQVATLELVEGAAALVGGALALWGRVAATKRIGGKQGGG
jgi:hypothetical protein